MTITLRQTKGSELTFQELDDNFTDLNGRITTLEGSGNTDNQMLTLVGNNLSISGGNTVDLSGLGGSSYADSDVDTHLNTSTATANQVLSWDGADYVWVADQTGGGGGIALTDLSVTVASASGTGNLTYNNTSGEFTYTPPIVYTDSAVDLHLRTTSANANEYLFWDGADYQWQTIPTLNVIGDVNFNSVTLDGSNGQGKVLAWDQTLTAFVPVDDEASSVTFTVHNNSGATLTKGEVVYLSGLNGNTPEVSKAQANNSNTMPAFGIVKDDIANTADGTVVTFGSCPGHNAADFGETGITFALGDTLYVSATEAGKLTNVAPAGESNLIQNIGKIERATPTTNMTIKVGGAGRTNATPNLNDGSIFIGGSNNRATTANFYNQIDVHLNQSNPTSGYVLSWDGADYAWVAQSGGGASVTVQDAAPGSGSTGDLWWESDVGVLKIYYGGTWVDASPAGSGSGGIALTDLSVTVASAGSTNLTYDNTTGAFTYTPPDLSSYLTSYTETDTLDSVVGRGATTTTTAVIPFYYANQAAFPNATTYHGAMAHSHADGSMFFAHSGTWNRMANITDLDFNILTNQSDAYKVNIQSTSLAQDHYPLMHSDSTGTGITPLVDTEYRYNPDTNTLSVHNVTVLTELTAPAINPVTDTVGATGTELVINGGEATALNSQGGDLTLDAGAGAILPGEINLGVNSTNTGQVNIGYSGSAVVVNGRTTFNGDVTLTTGTWETVNTSITTGAATVNVDCDSGHIVYLDASSGGFNSTFTINLVNLGNTSNVASAVTVVIKQPAGAGVLPNAIQIGGIGQTLLWQGGSAPTPNAGGNAHDVFTFSVLDLGATNVVLGQMVDYA